MVISEQQYGFMPGKSTRRCVCFVSMKYEEGQKEAALCFFVDSEEVLKWRWDYISDRL